MVTRQELENDLEYADIMEDVRQECERYGQVLSIVIPREKVRVLALQLHSDLHFFVDFSFAGRSS